VSPVQLKHSSAKTAIGTKIFKFFGQWQGHHVTAKKKYPAQQVLTQPIISQNLGMIRELEICIHWGNIYWIQMLTPQLDQ
jgi:hypothetical protein